MSEGELNRWSARSRMPEPGSLRIWTASVRPRRLQSFKRTFVDEVNYSKDEWIEQGKAIAT